MCHKCKRAYNQYCDESTNQVNLFISKFFHIPLLESSHRVQDVELLPSLSEVNDARSKLILVSKMNESQVLQDQTSTKRNLMLTNISKPNLLKY